MEMGADICEGPHHLLDLSALGLEVMPR